MRGVWGAVLPAATLGPLLLKRMPLRGMGTGAPAASIRAVSVEVLEGDCRAILPTLAEGSVHCVVTSPPYWGLRDYGVAGQLGLEATPEEYLACMVGVFREVHRVLRDDGTCWVNMGSSYASGDTSPNQFRARDGAPPCDSDGRAPADYPPADRACFCCDDGHRAATLIRHARIAHTALSGPRIALPPSQTDRDSALQDSVAASLGASLLDARASTMLSTNGHDPGVSSPATTALAYHAWLRSFAADVLPSVCSSCLNHPMFDQGFKAKDMVPMPWLLAMALQADGWFLRSDIIWAKPNPMPESVTDRPTKAHEYVFLLTKSARYFYDADAVREPRTDFHGPGNRQVYDSGRPDGITLRANRGIGPEARNLRTVWTIATEPTPEAHFATFPPALAQRCILAGSRMGDTVLDPFGGTGTVGAVAEQSGRHSILIELSAQYVTLLRARTAQCGLFTWRPSG